MPKKTTQITVRLTAGQSAFLERKKAELARHLELKGREAEISNSTVIQGLVDFWMTLEEGKKRR